MIAIDSRPEDWAGQVARLMVDRGRTTESVCEFFTVVFADASSS